VIELFDRLKRLYRRIRYGKERASERLTDYLRDKGIQIGEDVTFFAPETNVIDTCYPWLVTIGNHVGIAKGVIMLTHDYSWSVLKRYNRGVPEGMIFGACGKIDIGNNVFIGMDAIILRNVTIGDDVIIGANAVVTGNCESGWVYAGNPARKILTVAEYYEKRKAAQLSEARQLAGAYYERTGKKPPVEIFHEYFMLFSREEELLPAFREKMKLCGNYEASVKALREHPPLYASYEAFLEDCGLN